MTPFTLPHRQKSTVDWILFGAVMALSVLGLVTMSSFQSDDPFFMRQAIWIGVGVGAFFIAAHIDWRPLRRSGVSLFIYGGIVALLLVLAVVGKTFLGAQSWFDLGFAAFQPTEFAKLALIILLAKYFSRRHIEIANFRHIIVSGLYAFLLFGLVAVQPDFGSAIIIFLIWLGLVLCSGISRTHLFLILGLGIASFAGLWLFGFQDYQKQRIMTFIAPSDVHGAGYNAYQSMVAVGSGELLGKGIGYGTQSKLRYLPQYQTDFIFAAYAEEWGFIGLCLALALYGVVFWRLLRHATRGSSNFEALFALGVLCYFSAHVVLHAGINLGILPVTGTTIPFMSYGGSHLLAEFVAIGMVCGMSAYSRVAHPEALERDWRGGYDR